MEILSMSIKEINQKSVFDDLVKRNITQKEAAEQLELSERQVNRKFKKYKAEGPRSLVHGNRGKPSPRKTDPDKIKRIMDLMVEKYYDCGPTLAAEFLWEHEGIKIHKEVLRLYMKTLNIAYKQRKGKSYRKCRKRKKKFGHMVQLDGSIHMWFEDEQKYYVLLLFIDDATGTILHMELVDAESTKNLMSATHTYITKFGRPLLIYTDQGSVYKVNVNNKEKDKFTQYQKSLKKLGIRLIHAKSPEAKGRVERSFRTHQDRLVKEMRIRGISSLEEANAFFNSYYIDKHNRKFAKEAAQPGNLHRPAEKHHDLDVIFSTEEIRIMKNDWTIQYHNELFQLEKDQIAHIRPKSEITVHEHFDGTIRLSIRGYLLNFKKIQDRPRPTVIPAKKSQSTYIPPKDHPWRRTNSLFFK